MNNTTEYIATFDNLNAINIDDNYYIASPNPIHAKRQLGSFSFILAPPIVKRPFKPCRLRKGILLKDLIVPTHEEYLYYKKKIKA